MIADLDALRASLGSTTNLSDALLTRALVAAQSWVTDRVMVAELDSAEVQEAIVLLASRWYKRRQSPEGVAGWGDLGVIRILAKDPDIEALLERKLDYCRVGIA